MELLGRLRRVQTTAFDAPIMWTFAKNLLVLLLLALLAGYFAKRFPEAYKGSDFPEFYAAARIVRDGLGPQLYQPELQRTYQNKYAGGMGVYYNHPPFETLIYLPLSLLSLPRAYLLWCLFNAALLLVIARLFARDILPRLSWRVVLGLVFLFVPVLLNFLQGQDSVLLLFLFALAFAALKREHEFAAGCLLACALFKFHLVLPLVVVLSPRRPARFLGGFAAVGFLLLLVSVAISGWGFFAAYTRFIAYLEASPSTGNYPQAMATLYGLSAVLVPLSDVGKRVVTIASSLVILGLALHGLQSSVRRDLIFANAVAAAILVGYHLSPHDLTLLLLPLGLILNHVLATPQMPRWLRLSLVANLALLFFPPLYLWVLHLHMYAYAGMAVLTLFLLTYAEISRSRSHGQTS